MLEAKGWPRPYRAPVHPSTGNVAYSPFLTVTVATTERSIRVEPAHSGARTGRSGIGAILPPRWVEAKDRCPPRAHPRRGYLESDFIHQNPHSGNWPSFPTRVRLVSLSRRNA